jgi:MFS family permease
MIVGRGLQGLGGGVFPLCFGVVRDEFPKDKVPTGIALLGAIAAIGSSIGLPLGDVLTDGPGYHSIFVVAAIMGVLATATTLLFVPASPIRTPGRVDLRGAAILGVALAALLIAISRGADWGWDSMKTVALMLVGFNGLGVFGFLQRRTREPLVNMATFVRRPVTSCRTGFPRTPASRSPSSSAPSARSSRRCPSSSSQATATGAPPSSSQRRRCSYFVLVASTSARPLCRARRSSGGATVRSAASEP